jgi:hypothetical protein
VQFLEEQQRRGANDCLASREGNKDSREFLFIFVCLVEKLADCIDVFMDADA